MLVGLAVGVWVARHLGPEQYGLLSFAMAFVTLFAPLASLGLEDIVVRNLVRDPAVKEETLGTAFVLRLVGGASSIAAATLVVSLLVTSDGLTRWLVAILAAGALFQAFNVIECWFNSQVQAKYTVLARSAAFLVCSALRIALIVTGASLIWFAVVATVEVALASIGLVTVYRARGGTLVSWRPTLVTARSLIADSWPLFFSIISITLYQRIDQVMLQAAVGSAEVGIYSVAVRLVDAWAFIPSAIYWSVFPSILEAKREGEAVFHERLQRFYNLMAFSAYVVAVGATVAGPWLVRVLFGESYSGAGAILVVLSWANLFTSLEIARTAFLNAQNWNRVYLAMIVAGGALNIALNLVLIPRFGGLGAAVASLVAYWFAAHGSCFLFKNLRRTGLMLTKAMLYPKVW
jgi:O-antigen/teichoic acid export membrane protein